MKITSTLMFSAAFASVLSADHPFSIFSRATDAFKSLLNLELISIDGQSVDNSTSSSDSVAEDAALLAPELIRKYKYPVEVHNVLTEDGYILQVHRIPKPDQQPVLLMHGLIDTSATWVLMGPNQGLGYLLSDFGYDVWMGNVRGNRYSTTHRSMNASTNRRFWDFSLNEIGYYDLPASIDHILNVTKYSNLHYIGHSQANAVFWIMCSERPDYSTKIYSMHALAPIALFSEIRSPLISSMIMSLDFLRILINTFGIDEFLPNSEFLAKGTRIMCRDRAFTQSVCSNILFLIAGFNTDQLNTTMLPVVLSHTPSGASIKQMIHFAQLIKSGRFQKYDYGHFRNDMRYGSADPPEYTFRHAKMPTALYFSENDWLLDVQSVSKLAKALPNVMDKYLVPLKTFNHLDFCWATDAKKLLYGKLLDNMQIVESNRNFQ